MKPIEAVFISDLHLHPAIDEITGRFVRFVEWACSQTESLYILGDFFHAWPGDDSLNAWSRMIAAHLLKLSQAGVKCYFIPGNRDFLVSQRFAELAGWKMLADQTVIQLGKTRVLLSHGDRYCTLDKAHQWMRRLTRRAWFIKSFAWFPLAWRERWVQQVRHYSEVHTPKKSTQKMEVVPHALMKSLQRFQADVLIHGHTHRPEVVQHGDSHAMYTRYVLSDWDDSPVFLCYYKANGFKFNLFSLF